MPFFSFSHSITVVVGAVILDLLLGDPRWLPHPVVQIGRLITFLEKILYRVIPNRKIGGVLLLLGTVLTTIFASWVTIWGAYAVSPAVGLIMATIIAWTGLAARSLHRESGLVAEALLRGDLSEARRYLSYIVGRDTASLDAAEIWRGTVETVAENSSDGVVAPLFYLLLGGPVLAMAYKAANTLDSMVGYKNAQYLEFGWASARFDDLVNWLPSRICGVLMALAAPLVGLSGRNALRMMIRDGRNHSSPNSGIPEAAAAGALGVQLGGTNLYFGKAVTKPTIGDPLQPLAASVWRGAVRLMYLSEGIMLLCGLAGLTALRRVG